MGKPEIKRHAGVAFFGKVSLEADIKAFEWAYKHLPLSIEYKLRIIHVNELSNGSQPQERSRYDNSGDVPTKFPENYPDSYEITESFVRKLQADSVDEYICGVAYEAGNFEAALQYAIEKDGLDILVLAWWEEDEARKGPPVTINRLESEGCSIIFAKVDGSRKLTLSMPSTQTMSAATASTEDDPAATAAAPSSIAAALPDQPSNDGTQSASSNANTPAASTEVSESTTPARTSTTSKRSSKAPASGSETDSTPRPAGRDKDTGSAKPSSSRKTKAT